MKLSEAIEQMQEILKEHGDLDLLLEDSGFPLWRITMKKFKEDNPDWNCNAGDKVAMVDIND